MKYVFIINPEAGKGKSSGYIELIESQIKGKIDYEIQFTKGKGHATQIAKSYAEKGNYIVCAVGGDGTVNEVVNGLVGTSAPLAIIPAGSGNDFIRSLVPKKTNKNGIKQFIEGKQESIDVIQINGGYYLNIASIGLDAEIVNNAIPYKKSKWIKGEFAYIISLIKTLFGPKGIPLKINIAGEEISDNILMLTMANGKFYGGGIPIAPHAQLSDANIDVCLVKKISLLKICRLLPMLVVAKHEQAKEVMTYKVQSVDIESSRPFKLNVDGEISETQSVKIKLIPKAIQIIVPSCI